MTAKRYFSIAAGLRGCYLPDSVFVVDCATRRDLKAVLEAEASHLRDAGYVGASKRNIASLAADAWLTLLSPAPREITLPLAPSHARDSYCYALSVARVTRREYLDAARLVGLLDTSANTVLDCAPGWELQPGLRHREPPSL